MDVSLIKKMYRLLDATKRGYLSANWSSLAGCKQFEQLTPVQINHLLLIRFELPCNLNRIRAVTGLSSAGASTFIDRLVQAGVIHRETDPNDRRNVRIAATEELQQLFDDVDDGLDRLIVEQLQQVPQEQHQAIADASRIICDYLEKNLARKQ